MGIVTLKGQIVAAMVLPIALIAGCALAGGGLLLAAFALIAFPLMLVLAIPPVLGRFVGRMRAPGDTPIAYAIVTVALWLALLPLGFLVAAAEPAPLELGQSPAWLATARTLCLVAAGILWLSQVVLGCIGSRPVRPQAPASTYDKQTN